MTIISGLQAPAQAHIDITAYLSEQSPDGDFLREYVDILEEKDNRLNPDAAWYKMRPVGIQVDGDTGVVEVRGLLWSDSHAGNTSNVGTFNVVRNQPVPLAFRRIYRVGTGRHTRIILLGV